MLLFPNQKMIVWNFEIEKMIAEKSAEIIDLKLQLYCLNNYDLTILFTSMGIFVVWKIIIQKLPLAHISFISATRTNKFPCKITVKAFQLY